MPNVIAIVALVCLVAGFGAGWRVNEWREQAAKTAAVEKAQAAQLAEAKRADEIAARFERKLAGFRVVQKTFYNEVRNETIQRVYSDCVVPDSGRLLLNRAVAAANAGQPDAAVPAAAGSAKPANNGRPAGVGGGSDEPVRGVRWPAWLFGRTDAEVK